MVYLPPYHQKQPNVGTVTMPYMDGMGMELFQNQTDIKIPKITVRSIGPYDRYEQGVMGPP